MKSNKQKRQLLREKREEKKARVKAKDLTWDLKRGAILPVDFSKIISNSHIASVPDYYRGKPFICIDCGSYQLWTASKQKWWYEEAKGEIETIAIRCRECRRKERLRKAEARRIHLEGIERKK